MARTHNRTSDPELNSLLSRLDSLSRSDDTPDGDEDDSKLTHEPQAGDTDGAEFAAEKRLFAAIFGGEMPSGKAQQTQQPATDDGAASPEPSAELDADDASFDIDAAESSTDDLLLRASAIIAALVDSEQLVLVNQWGRKTLAGKIVPFLEMEASPAEVAAELAEQLLDEPEVVDLFADDAEIAALIANED